MAALLAIAAGPYAALAQGGGTVTGQVTAEETGSPLAGARIQVQGTALRAASDAQGRYRIDAVPAGSYTVTASQLGRATVSRSAVVGAGSTLTLDFALGTAAITMEGLVVNVVTGRAERERELGNVVGAVDVTALDRAALSKPADILTARVPGVDVRSVSGTTGTGQKIRIRGANSISLTNEPIVIVDGVRFDNGTEFLSDDFSEGAPDQNPNRFNDLNAEDIESVEVLKGPAASGIYGTAASNGVILVTTKKGSAGAPRWNAYVEGGLVRESTDWPDNIAALARRPAGGFSHCRNFQAASGACAQDSIARFNPFDADDFSPFRDGSRQKYGVNVSGGGDVATYYLSADVDREDGVYEVNKLDKVNLRANVRALLRDNLTVTASSSYLSSEFEQPGNDNSILSPILNGLLGRALFDRSTPERAYFRFGPEVTTEQFFATQDNDRFTGGLNLDWRPLSWLQVNGTGGIDFIALHGAQSLQPGVAPIVPTWQIGWVEENRSTLFTYTGNGAATATLPLGSSVISNSTAGFDYTRNTLGANRGKGFGVTPGTNSLDGTSSLFEVDEDNTDVITVGGFFQQQFSFNDRIYFSGALRADDNSAFGEDFGLIFYPSASASWVVSEEGFFPANEVLTSLRLRGAVGQSGQRPAFRQAVTFFSPAAAATPTGDEPGVVIGGTGNVDLEPERTRELEIGADAGLWNDRLQAEFTYFNRKTSDALLQRVLPPSLGQTNPLTGATSGLRFENIGELTNEGVELALDARVIDTDPVKWNVRVSGATLKNEIVELGEDIDPIIFNRGNQRHIAGFTAGGYWQPEITFADADGNGLLDLDEFSVADTATFIGPSLPTFTGALSSTLQLWDWMRVSTLFDRRSGHYQLNDNESFRCFFSAVTADRGCAGFDDPEASLEEQAAALADIFGDPETGTGSLRGRIEKADFTKWRELAVTLSVPEQWRRSLAALDGVSLTLAGRNLHTWTDYSGLDPEVNETSSGSNFTQGEFGSQPQVRYWTARLNVTF
jgi:TonB-linked SusC/RagA family outer membrane protein